MPKFSPYEILGIEAGATASEVRKKYKKLVRTYTPENDPEKFKEIRSAFEGLTEANYGIIDEFPIYRKPLEYLQQGNPASLEAPHLSPTILGEIFETPYNTAFELKKLLKTS